MTPLQLPLFDCENTQAYTTKPCKDCGRLLPLDQFPYGWNTCRDCKKAYRQRYYLAHCEDIKERVRQNRLADPEAHAERARRWRIENADRKRTNDKAYYEANKDRVKANVRRYKAEHPDWKREVDRAYHSENRERLRAQAQERRKRDPEKYRLIDRATRLTRRAKAGRVTRKDIVTMLGAQNGRCAYCDTILLRFHVDHKTPITRGGTSDPSNLCLACGYCNRSKSTKTEEEFRAILAMRMAQ